MVALMFLSKIIIIITNSSFCVTFCCGNVGRRQTIRAWKEVCKLASKAWRHDQNTQHDKTAFAKAEGLIAWLNLHLQPQVPDHDVQLVCLWHSWLLSTLSVFISSRKHFAQQVIRSSQNGSTFCKHSNFSPNYDPKIINSQNNNSVNFSFSESGSNLTPSKELSRRCFSDSKADRKSVV